MEDFDEYLKEDADAAERRAAGKVKTGLLGLRLESKVAAVAAERRAWLRRRFWIRAMLGLALVTTSGISIRLILGKGNSVDLQQQQSTEQPEILKNQPVLTPDSIPVLPVSDKKSSPIAENRESIDLPPPRFDSPNLRGENAENKAWKAMLDQVWYTDYPPQELTLSEPFVKIDQLLQTRDFNNAYVALQRLERKLPENDTLKFLKGYCLLEMGEGAEALSYFESLETKQPAWEMRLQWYRGLGLLLTGDKEKALTMFRKISAVPKHPFRLHSNRAIQLLE